MSRGEGELLTMLKPRAVGLLPVCLTMKPVGEPDALIGHVRFDERGWETERCRMAQATAPILDSTIAAKRCAALCLELAKADVHLTDVRPGDLTEQMQSRAASASTSARGYPPEPLGYSMTSSALASSVGGTSSPRTFAVFRLITSSYLVGC